MNQSRNEKIVQTQGLASRRVWPAWGILVAAIILTILTTFYMKSDVDVLAKREFIFACNEIRGKIDERLQAHETILLAGAAFFDASDHVTREQWRTFVQRLNVESNLPGIQGIGFALRIPPDRLAQHVQEIRSEGFPNYDVRPEGDRGDYSSIIYLEPFQGRNLRAFGYDMLSEPVRRAAMERARDQNDAALSGKVFLVQETEKDIQAGTLMYVPVYRTGMPTGTVEQRREALFGWVYSPYRMTDLMRGTLGGWDSHTGLRIRIQVYDGTLLSPDSILYDSQTSKDMVPAPQFTEELRVIFNGSPWTLRFTQTGGQVSLAKVWFTLAGGTIIGLLLFGLALSLLNSRSNALQMAERLTAELRESEDRHRSLVEHLPQRIFLKDRNSVYLSCNENYASDLDITPEQIVGKDDFAFHTPERAQAFRADDQACMTTDMVKDLEEIVQFAGQERWVHTIKVPYHDRQGQVIGVLGIFEDITDRKIAANSLHESEQFLSQSEKIGRIGGWKANPFTDSLQWTQGVYDIVEAPKDYIRSLDEGLEFYTPPYRPIIKEAIAKTLEHGEPFKVEAEVITTGGKHLWTEVRGLMRVEEGEDPQIIGSFQDITERKLAEEALRESQENFRTFFETMDDIIIVGTPDGKIIYSNPAVSRKLRYSPDELKAMRVLDLHPLEKRQEAERIFAEMFKGERDVCPLPLAKKDGVYLPVETRVCFGKWSGMDCIFGISKDLTNEQEALQKFNRLFSSNPAPMAVSSFPQRKFTDVNDSFLSTLGFSRDEVIGKTSEELGIFTASIQSEIVQMLEDQGCVRNVEIKVRKKDGTIVDGIFSGEIIENQGQKSFLTVMVDITERKHMEELLKQSEEKFRTVADFTYDWEYWIGSDGSLIYVAPSCERITGYRSDEFINNPGLLQEIIYLEDQSLVGNHFHTTDSGDPHEVDFRIVTRSGETVWIGHSCQAVYGEDGRWLGRRVSNRDITERKQVEELLNIASAYNRSLIETSPDPLVTISAEGKITDVNTATQRFTGCSRDELIGTDFSDYFTDTEKAHAGYQQVFRDGSVKDYELELRHKNGQAITVLYNASLYRDESGKVMGIFAAARDITDLKNAERKLQELNQNLEERVAERSADLIATNRQLLREINEHSGTASSLRESEQRMKMVIESSPVGIFVIQDEKYTFANQAFVNIFGLTDSSDVIGTQLETLYSADSGKRISDIARQCVDRSEMININGLQVLTRDEQACHLNIWIQPIETWGSSAVMGFMVDISGEVELRSHLNKSQKMEALGSLAGGIAHDFNNVLFGIGGYTELALKSVPSDSLANKQLKQVLAATERAANLVRHILTFSREAEQEKRPLLISLILKESLNFLRATITQNVEIRRNISADLHSVKSDPTQIHQIIMNLVTNAAHAMKNTGGVLEVSLVEVSLTEDFVKTRPGMVPGTYQKLKVSDTGHGMTPETLGRIFDPYFTTKQPGEGTGLGLSVVYGIVRDNNGTITVSSVPDAGTTFEVYFPIVMEKETSSEETDQVAPLGTGRILLVDDETMVTEPTKSAIEDLGYEVVAENDPVRALSKFKAQPYSFDLIITDMSMPKMTGLQLSWKISEIRKDIPIILITGFSDLLDDKTPSDYGIREFIYKPIRKLILAQTISKVLTKQDLTGGTDG